MTCFDITHWTLTTIQLSYQLATYRKYPHNQRLHKRLEVSSFLSSISTALKSGREQRAENQKSPTYRYVPSLQSTLRLLWRLLDNIGIHMWFYKHWRNRGRHHWVIYPWAICIREHIDRKNCQIRKPVLAHVELWICLYHLEFAESACCGCSVI